MVHQTACGPQPHERAEFFYDPDSGLSGVIVLHSTHLGPAMGGCRFWRYDSREAAYHDAARLAEGMSYKNALAGLPLGGGKAVLRIPSGKFDRGQLFEAFGRAVQRLDGKYVTAEDVGTTMIDMAAVRRCTSHVAGLEVGEGQAGGDPSPWTALGVLRSMEVAAVRQLGRPLPELTVAVQGLGNVGMDLCRRLHDIGVGLVVADVDPGKIEQAETLYAARAVSPDAILTSDVDVVVPCALGAVLDAETIPKLRAAIVCGAANNQLARDEDGDMLADRGILYAPDYVVNAGGIISVAAEYLGWSRDEVRWRADAIGMRFAQVLDAADENSVPAHRMADTLARQTIERGKAPAALAIRVDQ